jgi:hypothetical protein
MLWTTHCPNAEEDEGTWLTPDAVDMTPYWGLMFPF